jgi:hypothetical protein
MIVINHRNIPWAPRCAHLSPPAPQPTATAAPGHARQPLSFPCSSVACMSNRRRSAPLASTRAHPSPFPRSCQAPHRPDTTPPPSPRVAPEAPLFLLLSRSFKAGRLWLQAWPSNAAHHGLVACRELRAEPDKQCLSLRPWSLVLLREYSNPFHFV